MYDASIDVLEDNTEGFIREISAEMLERVYKNWPTRMDHLRRGCGQYFNFQTLNYMAFRHFSEFDVFFSLKNFPIALKKSPDIYSSGQNIWNQYYIFVYFNIFLK